ncbi:hypothetical protein ACP70R_031164 [Stipagrostis hirtigluma subsp. patula]
MDPAGGDDEVGELGGLRVPGGVDQAVAADVADACRNLGRVSGSRKRIAAVMPTGSDDLTGNEDSDLLSEDSWRISTEIENLRSQLAEKKKELRFSQEIKKLRDELALKEKDVECLKKQNDELKAKNEGLQNNVNELWLRKQNEELQANCEGLQKNIVAILENQIYAKKLHLRQFEGLHRIMEFPYAQIEEGKFYNGDKTSKVADGPLTEKIDANREVEGDKSKQLALELEAAKLDAEIFSKTEKLGEMLECEKFSEELGSLAVWKSIEANIELHAARRELMVGLEDIRGSPFGIKRMGEFNIWSLKIAFQRKYGNDEASVEAAMLLAVKMKWELSDPSWHPFKIVEANGRLKEVVDEDDAKLKELMSAEYGEDVYDAVKTALSEMNEYNASGRYPVRELWNFKEERKATVKEVLQYLFRRLRKKSRPTPVQEAVSTS